LALGGGAIAFYHFQGLGDSAAKLKLRLTNVEPKRPSGGKAITRIGMEASNVGRNDIRLDFIDAEIRLGDLLIGTLNENAFANIRRAKPEFGVIKSRSRSIINLDVRTGIAETAINLLMSLFSGSLTRTLTVTGYAMAEGVRFPINYSKTINLGD
jgi:hypothetical protein